MRDSDGVGDRKPEAHAVERIQPLLGTCERLEQGWDDVFRHAGSAVFDLEHGITVSLGRVHADPAGFQSLYLALGATPTHVGTQFVAEATVLALAGGTAGAVLGALATTTHASARQWPAVVPTPDLLAAVALAVAVGAAAGLYPAIRAARLSPTEALRAP